MAMNQAAGAAEQTPLRFRVAAEVRAWRARRNMTQQQLARALGLSQAQTSAKLRGLQPISLDEIERLADIFGCSPEELMQPALRDYTPATGIRVTSAQFASPPDAVTRRDDLAERRRRRRMADYGPHLPRPIIVGPQRHLRVLGA